MNLSSFPSSGAPASPAHPPVPGHSGPAYTGSRTPPRNLRLRYVVDDLHDRLARLGPSAPLPSASEIARSYRITVPTAQFARRMLTTRLRPAARAGSAAARYADSAWRRVAGDLEERIRSGRLHGRLPAQPDLADEYGVCVDTLRRAVRLLADEGLVTLSGPKGTFVRKPLGGVPRL